MKTIERMWPREYVFLLTHADSLVPAFASLMCEQLGIVGMPGSGLMYRRRSDLARLRGRVALAHRRWPQGRFLFDAITDQRRSFPPSLTSPARLRTLVCIRRPIEALLEIRAMSPGSSLSQAADSYCDQLEWLASTGASLGERALVFPTEMIVEDTNALLGAVAEHLGICRNFCVHVACGAQVYEPSISKPRARQMSARFTPPMDPLIIGRCQEAYHYAFIELGERCPSIGLPCYTGDSGTTWLDSIHVEHAGRGVRPARPTAQSESMLECWMEVAG
jgi:hypothetical protein